MKANVPFDNHEKMLGCLKAVAKVSAEKLDPTRCFGIMHDHEGTAIHEWLVVRDSALSLLVGFGLRFFVGDLKSRPAEEPFSNFPPGGEVTDSRGRKFEGAEARAHAIGRDRESGRVICRMSGKLLNPEVDGSEVNLAYNESHILKACGGVTAPFSAPFPPLSGSERNVFNTQDIRIRRRGVSFCEIDTRTGAVVYGLHFVCFQNNIQQTGFEFINNIWLMNSDFRSSKDGLFDVHAGIVEPVEGCYYFIPPEYGEFPGEVFFD